MKKPEKYIKDYTKNCSNEYTFGTYAPWLSPENALSAVKLAREEFLYDACKWLKENIDLEHDYPNSAEELIRDFKKAMNL